jgi:hypothetical protein
MLSKSSPSTLDRRPRQGQVFNLPLPTLVSGQDAAGRAFQEHTVLFYISDSGASFNLKNVPAPGARLKLSIDLPPSLDEDRSLKLVINGRVALIEEPEAPGDRQRVSLRFESRYIIQAEEQH